MSINKIIEKMPKMFFDAQKLSNFPPEVTLQALHDDNSGPDEAVDLWVQKAKQNQFGEFTTPDIDLDQILEEDPDALDKAVFQISNPGAMMPPEGMSGTLLPTDVLEAIILQYPGVMNLSTGIASQVMGGVDEILEEAEKWHEHTQSQEFMALQQSGGDPAEMAAILTQHELNRIGNENLEGGLTGDDIDSTLLDRILDGVGSVFKGASQAIASTSPHMIHAGEGPISEVEEIINSLNESLVNDGDLERPVGTELASMAIYTDNVNFIRNSFPNLFEDWLAQNSDRIDPDLLNVISETVKPYGFYSTPPLVPRPEGYEMDTMSRFDDVGFITDWEEQVETLKEGTRERAEAEEQYKLSAAEQASDLSFKRQLDTIIQSGAAVMPDRSVKSQIVGEEFGRTPGSGLYPFAPQRGQQVEAYADMLFSMYHPEQKYTDEFMGSDIELASVLSPTESTAQSEYRDWMRKFFDSPDGWADSQERDELSMAHDILRDMKRADLTGIFTGHAVNFHPSNRVIGSEFGGENRWKTLMNRLGVMGVGSSGRQAIMATLPNVIDALINQGLSYSDITERVLETTKQRSSGQEKETRVPEPAKVQGNPIFPN